jgi:hypothetical protein
MRRVYLCSELDAVARRGPEHSRVDREKRELEEAIATRYEAVAASARYKARYHADLQAAEALVRMPEEGAAEAAAMRVHLDSSLAEPVKRRRRRGRSPAGAAQGVHLPDALRQRRRPLRTLQQ